MLTARKMFGGLAVLMLSTRAEAFCAFPMSRTSMNVRRAASSTEVSASRSFGSSKCISLRSGASIRRSGSTLRMSAESAGDVKRADLEDREFQLEELEDRDVAETSVVLNKDGTVTAGATNGPLPLSVRGKWSLDGDKFNMEISREFDASIPYTVARVYMGYIDEVLPATDTMILTGDIVMEEMDVGFFKMISAPSDILDSLKHIDDKIAQRPA